jgi:nitrilase
MAAKQTKFKVAAAHAAPVFMNKAATIRKTIALIEQAAEGDIKLLVFPETFVPGYPVSDPTWPPKEGGTILPRYRALTRTTVLGRMLRSPKAGWYFG